MLEFKLYNGNARYELESTGEVRCQASAKTKLTLYGMRGQTAVPLESGENIRFKGKLADGFDAIEVRSHGKAPFGCAFEERRITHADPLNDDNPPAIPPPAADNLVAQMHRIAKAHARRNVPVLEPDELAPWAARYTIDDDDWDFEEEIAARSVDSQQASSEVSPQGDPQSRTTEGTDRPDVPPDAARPDGPPDPINQLPAE